MKSEREISQALETYDHLLWEAIIRVGGVAFSKSFERRGNLIRVVYATYNEDSPSKAPFDPRPVFSQIEDGVFSFTTSSLPVIKLGYKSRGFTVASNLCSHPCYKDFLFNAVLTERKRIDLVCFGSMTLPIACDFVEIGNRSEKDYICCPCVGEHLSYTSDLLSFKVVLQKPKKVGKHNFEFRFEIISK